MTLSSSFRYSRAVLVNDDGIQREVLALILENAGFEVERFSSASNALVRLNNEPFPDIIITDIYMPEIDGIRFCRQLRSPGYLHLKEVPILVVSATYSGMDIEQIISEVGANAFLPAPVNADHFVLVVEGLLNGVKIERHSRVMLVENDEEHFQKFDPVFKARGFETCKAGSCAEARQNMASCRPDIIILHDDLPDGSNACLLSELEKRKHDLIIIMVTRNPAPGLALDWLKRGAAAYIRMPYEDEYLVELCIKAQREKAMLRIEDLLQERTQKLRQQHEDLRISQSRYQSVFENSPIPIWEEDFSLVKQTLDELRQSGVIDIEAYLKKHPEFIHRCIALVKVVDLNRATLLMHGVSTKEEIKHNLNRIIDPQATFFYELINVFNGITHFSIEGKSLTLDEEKEIDIQLYWSVAPGFEKTYGKVYVSPVNITERKKAEREIRRLLTESETLRQSSMIVSSALSQDAVAERTLQQIKLVIPYDNAIIQIIDNGELKTIAYIGDKEPLEAIELDFSHHDTLQNWPLFETLVEKKQYILVDDAGAVYSVFKSFPSEQIGSWLGVPLVVHDKVIGLIGLSSNERAHYNHDHARLAMAFASQTAMAIENARLYAEVSRLAIEDDLTGLYNRRGLMELGKREVDHALRYRHPLVALFLDIDNFRDFNNRYSYTVGDLVLKTLANLMLANSRDSDLIGRYGGEEFVILLGETDLDGAFQLAERLRQEVEKTQVQTVWGELSVTVSIGVAFLQRDVVKRHEKKGDEPHALVNLIEQAAEALHQAKAGGRNRVVVFHGSMNSGNIN